MNLQILQFPIIYEMGCKFASIGNFNMKLVSERQIDIIIVYYS